MVSTFKHLGFIMRPDYFGRKSSSRVHHETDETSKTGKLEKTSAAAQFYPGLLTLRNM